MSAYSNSVPPNAINAGDIQVVWNAENVPAGINAASASVQVALGGPYGVGNSGIEVSGFFAADPGTFELDVQVADFDIDAQYQTVANGNIASVDATRFTFHFDGPTVKARFARLLMRTLTNAVKVTASIGR